MLVYGLLAVLWNSALAVLPEGNRCHFVLQDKVIYLKPLQRMPYYEFSQSGTTKYLFNFCRSFAAPATFNCSPSFSMRLDLQNQSCTRFSSNDKFSNFRYQLYTDEQEQGVIFTELSDEMGNDTSDMMSTEFTVICSQDDGFRVEEVQDDGVVMRVLGYSKYACPIIDINRFWAVLAQNTVIFGIVLFCIGLVELFYGKRLLKPTIFIAAYGLSFIGLGAIVSQLLIRPDSSQISVYFCLLIIVLLSSVIAYFATNISNLSVFLIGAWMGLIMALLVNSMISGIFASYSTWSLYVLAAVFCLGLGFMASQYYDGIVVLSTSLTGAYLVVRPISWIVGGFPNELELAEEIKAHRISGIPGSFYVYLLVIVVLTALGASYQFVKLRRDRAIKNGQAPDVGGVESTIEAGVDLVMQNTIEGIISKYMTDEQKANNREMEMGLLQQPVLNQESLKTPNNPPVARIQYSDKAEEQPLRKIQGKVIRFSAGSIEK